MVLIVVVFTVISRLILLFEKSEVVLIVCRSVVPVERVLRWRQNRLLLTHAVLCLRVGTQRADGCTTLTQYLPAVLLLRRLDKACLLAEKLAALSNEVLNYDGARSAVLHPKLGLVERL